jgi:hypothetical protein
VRSSVNQPAASAIKPVEAASLTTTQTKLSKLIEDEGVEGTGKFQAQPAPPPPVVVAPIVSPSISQPTSSTAGQSAVVQILSGPNAGKELELIKSLTTLGKPGMQVAVLTRRPHGFFITHVEGDKFPSVNGEVLTNQARQLHDNDVIELAGIKMEFYFKG